MRRTAAQFCGLALLLALPACRGASTADPPAAPDGPDEPTPTAELTGSGAGGPTAPVAPAATWEPPATREPDTFAGAPAAPAPPCEHLWAANLVGDAADELICTRTNVLTVLGADGEGFRPRLQVTGTGLPNAAWHGDRDGDGREEFLVAFGMGRGFATAPVQVLELDAEEGGGGWWIRTLFEYTGPRPQVTALAGPRLFLAHFQSKYTVRSGYLLDGSTLAEERVLQMAMAQVPADVDGDGDDELAVGRMYGDEPRSDGDLACFEGDRRGAIPTERGVKALIASDLDGDGRAELLFGDGWHFRYREEGKARLNVASLAAGEGSWQTQLIHDLPDEYTVMRIEARDVDGDGRQEVFASGNATLYRLDLQGPPVGGIWSARKLGACGTGGEFALVRRPSGGIQILTATDPPAWLEP